MNNAAPQPMSLTVSQFNLPPERPDRRAWRCAFFALWAGALAGCAGPAILPPQDRVRVAVIRVGQNEATLDGIEPIRGFGVERDNTFMHCLELVLAALGRPIPYEDLMGLGGAAFRLQVRVDTWCSSGPDALVGYDCVAPVMAAVGLDYVAFYPRRDSDSDVQRIRREVVRSINLGLPVLASNVIPPADWGIIAGYRQRGAEWRCRAYADAARERDQRAVDWPLAVIVISPPKPPADMRPAYMASLKRAVELYETSLAGDYVLGRAAFDHWSRQLMLATDRSYIQPNAWTYASLLDARTAASRFLRGLAQKLPAHQGTLNAAADLYAREAELLRGGFADVPFPAQIPVGLASPDQRRRQVDLLREARDLEAQAVDLLKRIR